MFTTLPFYGFLPLELLAGLGNAEVQQACARIPLFQEEDKALFEGLSGPTPLDPKDLASRLEKLEEGYVNWPPFLKKPDYIAHLQRLGRFAEERDCFEESATIYRHLLRVEERYRGGAFPMTWYNLGHALFGASKFEEAAEAFRRSLAIRPHPRAWCALAKALWRLQRLDEALKAIDASATAGGGDMPQTYFIKGLILRARGDLKESVEAFQEAIRLENGGFAKSFMELGTTLRVMGNHEESLRILTHALTIEPNFGIAYFERALTLHAMDRFEEALHDFERGEKSNNLSRYERFVKAVVLRNLDRCEEAVSILEKLTQLPKPRAGVFNELGICYRYQKRLADSLAMLDRAVALEPTRAKNWLERGITRKLLNDLEGALSDVERALELEEGRYVFSFCEKSTLLSLMGRLEDSLRILLAIKDRFRESDDFWLYKGIALARLGRLEEALDAFKKASDLSPKDSIVLLESAKVLIQLERYEEAWGILEDLLTHAKKKLWGEIYLQEASILYYQKRHRDSLQWLRRAQAAGLDLSKVTKWRTLNFNALNA